MELRDLVSTGSIFAPWPLAIGDVVLDGQQMPISPLCIARCGTSPACHVSATGGGESVCEFGMSFFSLAHDGEKLTVFGLRGPKNPNTTRPATKQALKGRMVTLEAVNGWLAKCERLLALIESQFQKRQAEMLDPLHDPIRMARQVQKISHELVRQANRGACNVSLDSLIEKCDGELKSLVKAANLLVDSFELLTIYFNPNAACFGRKQLMSLWGMLMKHVSIFRMEKSDGGPTGIFLDGECHRNVEVYESFKLVPYTILSNAVKYSKEGPVRVNVSNRQNSIHVTIESQGPLIEQDELARIFEKKFRGKWAKESGEDGNGVGLYLAKVVAKANGFDIAVTSTPLGRKKGSIPLARNVFYFDVPT